MPELSPSQVFYILSLYIRFWRQRLLSESLPPLPDPYSHTALHPSLRTAGKVYVIALIDDAGRPYRHHHSLLQTLYPHSKGLDRAVVPDHEGPVDGIP